MWQATEKAIELIKLVSHYNKISAHCIVQDNIYTVIHTKQTHNIHRTEQKNRTEIIIIVINMPKVIKLNELQNTENGN